MRRISTFALALIMCLSVCSVGASAVAAEPVYEIELVDSVIEYREADKQVRSGNAEPFIEYFTVTETFTVRANGTRIASYDCIVDYTYGRDQFADETGIDRVEFEITYLHSNYTNTWEAAGDYKTDTAFRGTATLVHKTANSGCTNVFTGRLNGQNLTLNCTTTALPDARIASLTKNGGTATVYELVGRVS